MVQPDESPRAVLGLNPGFERAWGHGSTAVEDKAYRKVCCGSIDYQKFDSGSDFDSDAVFWIERRGCEYPAYHQRLLAGQTQWLIIPFEQWLCSSAQKRLDMLQQVDISLSSP